MLVMLILILIDVQYSQTTVFSFEKGSNRQNHSSGSHHPVKKFSRAVFTTLVLQVFFKCNTLSLLLTL